MEALNDYGDSDRFAGRYSLPIVRCGCEVNVTVDRRHRALYLWAMVLPRELAIPHGSRLPGRPASCFGRARYLSRRRRRRADGGRHAP